MDKIIKDFNEWLCSLKAEMSFWKYPFLILFVVYFLGILSIIRANYNYLDDIGRIRAGYLGWDDFSRYLNVALATIIHSDTLLNDISPLPQLFAVVITAASSVILIKVFTKEFSWWSVVAVIPLGLSPYFLECLSFKFDSPYMALSVFASVFPLLFIDGDEKLYLMMVAFGALVMFTTYQASSGIFIVCLCFLLALQWSQGKALKECLNCFFKSSCVFVIVAVLFKVLLVKEFNDYVSTDIVVSKNIIGILCKNIRKYIYLLWMDSTPAWRIFFGAICLCFVRTFTMQSCRSRVKSFLLSVIILVICGVLSYGGYLVLQKPLFYPRAMYSFGVYVAIIGLISVNYWSERMFSKTVALFLSWSLFVFALAYGNALAEQKRYDNFRVQMLLNDLNKLPKVDENNPRKMQLKGSGGFSPVVYRMSERYPILNRLVHVSIEGGYCLGEYYIFHYFNLKGIEPEPNWGRDHKVIEDENMPIVSDSIYHIIKADNNSVIVILKEFGERDKYDK